MNWDVFISHAHEDKDFVRPLAAELERAGLRVWYDDFALTVGDGLRRSIDRGLAQSRFGIVVFSRSFFAKHWTQYELDGLVQREEGGKVILPVWHQIGRQEIRQISPSLADRVAISSQRPLSDIVSAIKAAIAVGQTDAATACEGSDIARALEKPRLDLLRDMPTESTVEEQDREDPWKPLRP